MAAWGMVAVLLAFQAVLTRGGKLQLMIAIGVLGTAIWVVLIKRRMADERNPRAFVSVHIAELDLGFD